MTSYAAIREDFKGQGKANSLWAFPVGATIRMSLTFFAPGFRNTGIFPEPGTSSHLHSLKTAIGTLPRIIIVVDEQYSPALQHRIAKRGFSMFGDRGGSDRVRIRQPGGEARAQAFALLVAVTLPPCAWTR